MATHTMKAFTTGKRSLLTLLYRAIIHRDISHGYVISNSWPTPQIAEDEVLVKVHSVALNPTDWKHLDWISGPHCLMGCDYSGDIVEIGPKAKGDWKVGDRVAGITHGNFYSDKGAFATYLKMWSDALWRLPENMTYEEAATYGVASCTAMQCLYHNLDMPWPDNEKEAVEQKQKRTIFIYGASTTTGLMLLQMVRQAGWKAIATASPHSFELCKQFGADECFDYHSPSVVSDIGRRHPDITRAVDCIGEGNTAEICDQVLSENGGKLASLAFAKQRRTNVEVIRILAYTLCGEPFQFFPPLGPKFPAVPRDRQALSRFMSIMPQISAWLKPTPLEVLDGGFDAIAGGLDRLRRKGVSGKKLIVNLV